MKKICFYILLTMLSNQLLSQEAISIKLLQPQINKGKLLMEALSNRCSSRDFSERELTLQELSNLLWAANGVNREQDQKHTAPTAMNRQEISIYVFLKEGVYLYDPHQMLLKLIEKGDLRAFAGKQDFVKTAPVNLLYVADYMLMGTGTDSDKTLMAYADAAFIGENVYLFCAAFDMACVVRAYIDREATSKKLQLAEHQHIILGQTLGFAK